ncbi:MAG: NYN domain-containing protein [Acidobacteriota bacterium]
MPYIIDGNNLIGHPKEINLKSPHSRKILIKELLVFQKEREATLIVVFDGLPNEDVSREHLALGGLEILFAGQKEDADSLILKIISKSPDPASFILVSSDKSLTDRAKHLKANVMKCHQFRKKMESLKTLRKSKLEPKLEKEEVDKWVQYFNDPRNRKI